MIQVSHDKDLYLSSFDALESSYARTDPDWLHKLRKDAVDCYAGSGMPTTRHEAWKYTNVAPLKRLAFKLGEAAGAGATATRLDEAEFSFGAEVCLRLVFVDGHFSERLSSSLDRLPGGASVVPLRAAIESHADLVAEHLGRYASCRAGDERARTAAYAEDAPFVALNTAFLGDGALVHVQAGVDLEPPVHLVFLSTSGAAPTVSHPRVLVVAGDNSRLRIIEDYASAADSGDAQYFTNAVTEVMLGPGAHLDHYKLERDGRRSFHIATLAAYLDRDSNLVSHSVALGGGLVRNDVHAVLAAEGVECTLNGLTVATGKQHVDNHTRIVHARPHCNSYELYKAVLDDEAQGVFNGKIFVEKDAQKTDAKQTNQSLLLSDNALMNAKPELEIYADDVKCTHGATVGQLQEDALFYLRSRGIGEEAARSLLIYAFANDVVSNMTYEPLRQSVEASLFAKLSGGSHALKEVV